MHQFSLLAGALVGLSVAMPIGPMGLLCIQRTLVSGWLTGLSTGLGAATVNLAYGAMILLGLEELAPLIAGSGRVLGLAGAVFLLWSAMRVLRRPVDPATQPSAGSPLAAYGSAVTFNASNPMSLLLMTGLLSPLAGVPGSLLARGVFLAGLFLAAATWWLCLTFGVALLRSRLSPAGILLLNRVAGLALTLYGMFALAHAAQMP